MKKPCCMTLILLIMLSAFAHASTLCLPEGVTEIGEGAFYGMTSLEEVILPEGLLRIGSGAFSGSSVRAINLPDSLVYIADDTFSDTPLESVSASPASYAGVWALSHGYMNYRLTMSGIQAFIAAGCAIKAEFTAESTGLYSFASDGAAILEKPMFAGETTVLSVSLSETGQSGTVSLSVTRSEYEPVITTGTQSIALGGGETTSCYFSAAEDGEYTFSITSSEPVKARLRASSEQLESGEGTGFSLTRSFTKGQEAVLELEFVSAAASGGYVTLETGCAYSTQITYRALLIGQSEYLYSGLNLTACAYDVKNMEAMLKTVNGGAYTGNIKIRESLSRSDVSRAIASAFDGATEDDVSLVMWSGHGDNSPGESSGALITWDLDEISTAEFARMLSAVPGKVIVIIDACGSGALISNGESENGFDSAAFTDSVISAFASADPGITVEDENSGELRRENKFYVLTAAAEGEYSYCYDTSSALIDWFIESAGGTGASLTADADRDGRLTLSESFAYIAAQAETTVMDYGTDGDEIFQHPQVYPANSGFVLFTK